MDDLVDGMLSGDPGLWEKAIEEIQSLQRRQHAELWGAMLNKLARNPPPLQGDLSQDQWLAMCRAHYREIYLCATNKQPNVYMEQNKYQVEIERQEKDVQSVHDMVKQDQCALTAQQIEPLLQNILQGSREEMTKLEAMTRLVQPLHDKLDQCALTAQRIEPHLQIILQDSREQIARLEEIKNINTHTHSLLRIDYENLQNSIKGIQQRMASIQDFEKLIDEHLRPIKESLTSGDRLYSTIIRELTLLSAKLDSRERVAESQDTLQGNYYLEIIKRLKEENALLSAQTQQQQSPSGDSDNSDESFDSGMPPETVWEDIWPKSEQLTQLEEIRSFQKSDDEIGIIGSENKSTDLSNFFGEIDKLLRNKNIRALNCPWKIKRVDKVIFAHRDFVLFIVKKLKDRFSEISRQFRLDTLKHESPPQAIHNIRYKHNLGKFSEMIEVAVYRERVIPAYLVLIACHMFSGYELRKLRSLKTVIVCSLIYPSAIFEEFKISVNAENDLKFVTNGPFGAPLNWDSESWFKSFNVS